MNTFSVGKRHLFDAVIMIHYVITTAYRFPYTAKFMLDGVRNNKTKQIIR